MISNSCIYHVIRDGETRLATPVLLCLPGDPRPPASRCYFPCASQSICLGNRFGISPPFFPLSMLGHLRTSILAVQVTYYSELNGAETTYIYNDFRFGATITSRHDRAGYVQKALEYARCRKDIEEVCDRRARSARSHRGRFGGCTGSGVAS